MFIFLRTWLDQTRLGQTRLDQYPVALVILLLVILIAVQSDWIWLLNHLGSKLWFWSRQIILVCGRDKLHPRSLHWAPPGAAEEAASHVFRPPFPYKAAVICITLAPGTNNQPTNQPNTHLSTENSNVTIMLPLWFRVLFCLQSNIHTPPPLSAFHFMVMGLWPYNGCPLPLPVLMLQCWDHSQRQDEEEEEQQQQKEGRLFYMDRAVTWSHGTSFTSNLLSRCSQWSTHSPGILFYKRHCPTIQELQACWGINMIFKK